ncbi:MAG: hypothetical protein R2761_23650 [Acidimicrobiales bacterium]
MQLTNATTNENMPTDRSAYQKERNRRIKAGTWNWDTKQGPLNTGMPAGAAEYQRERSRRIKAGTWVYADGTRPGEAPAA